MKLAENTKLIKRSGLLGEEKEFTMAVTAQAFHVMSSTLYSNKIRAIIRELSCNAADAHIDAGNEVTPYIVHLPDSIDRTFRIRDFGTGLSTEQMDNVYTQYFTSTKTETNEQTGCLGLGSKSPFAYTDNFSVTSFYNGKKYVYAAFKNEKGNPSISLILETDTDEPNGVEVKFAVRSSDFYRFESEAVQVYQWFDLKPSFEGSKKPKIPEVVKELEGKGWFVSNQGPGALMGNILYSIQPEHLENYLDANLINVLNLLKPILKFPLGTLEFQPSRENLSYEKRTIEAIKKRVSEIQKTFQDEISSKIQNAKTKWDAYLELQKVVNTNSIKLKKYTEHLVSSGVKFDWHGQKISSVNIKADLGYNDAKYCTFDKFWLKRNWRSGDYITQFRPQSSVNHVPDENKIYVFLDSSKDRDYTENKFRTWLRGYKDQYKETTFYFLPVDDKDFVQKFIEALGATLGENYFWWHDMPKTIKPRTGGGGGGGGRKRCQAKLLNKNGSTGYGHKDSWFKDYEEVDLEKGEGFYLDRKGNSILYKGIEISPPYDFISMFNRLCLDDKKVEKIVTFTPSQKKKIGSGWINLVDYYKEEIPKLWTDEVQSYLSSQIGSGDITQKHQLLKGLLEDLPKNDILNKGTNKELWKSVEDGFPSVSSSLQRLSSNEVIYFFRRYSSYFNSYTMKKIPGFKEVSAIDTSNLKADKKVEKFTKDILELYEKQYLFKYLVSSTYGVYDYKQFKQRLPKEICENVVEVTLCSEGLIG